MEMLNVPQENIDQLTQVVRAQNYQLIAKENNDSAQKADK